ncbi:hypothetical protein AUEXF2481DRAFT_7135 [Aureobasidium subglaciale EXF-2481]|uniref:Uncharacterized protein n=1 Tax=Aureobasidium subglaciale (strain EXF-2481) TaxID=1043005 RepID=A0A074Y5Z2_AURSE|nr:uncharacterized protein AUEXF2481DRAFT_7135 [Aureobasidium subglaciale EXF-2481]KAI5206986.1 hypothetical protein E4T38_03530 [Aureobasidium subglaciale]KAI5225628.1 hypothetical protein E4T40_03305 [Aureobasidium subglaciale]KAI5229091.1 hypothetical protein E4T41_03631 [Aureobasidium subglaciale]KAI5263877.1 hypothetical protein E4T46_03304 [Aureobasidium subglaciale]KEQ93188.1 hypothetical protein AUEXF2481DRAFT_7135 [Aureobasidium subglaciale EXF-2481]
MFFKGNKRKTIVDNDARSSDVKRSFLRRITPTPYINRADPIPSELSLEYLNENDYINLSSISAPDPGFGYGKHTTPAVAYRHYKKTNTMPASGEVIAIEEDLHIHPIFSRDMWETQEIASASNSHWDTLKPVWQLATLLLEEKVMSGYLVGMLDRGSHYKIEMSDASPEVYWFQVKERPSKQELWLLWEDIWDLKDSIRFAALEVIEAKDHDVFGISRVNDSRPGLSKNGVGSTILINENILNILISRNKSSQFSTFWIPGTDDPSADLRLQYCLAATLVHEIIHSLWFARFGAHVREPFYRDTRFAELGWQFESMLFDGAITAICDRPTLAYGLNIKDWPGSITRVTYPLLLNYGCQGSKRAELFPVDMKWIAQFWKQDFWDKVEKHGSSQFICPRADNGVYCRA